MVFISFLNTSYALADLIVEPEETNPVNQLIEFFSNHTLEVGIGVFLLFILITDILVLRHIRKKKTKK